MTKYAVGYTDCWGTALTVEIVEAGGWKEALSKHSHFANSEYTYEDNVGWLSDDIKQAKQEMFNTDCEFDVAEIK